MKKFENLQLISVEYNENHTTATLNYLNSDSASILPVKIHTEKYDESSKTWQKDVEQEQRADETAKNELGVEGFDQLPGAIESTHDVYQYDNYYSLFERQGYDRFDEKYVDSSIVGEIKEVKDNDTAILIVFDFEGTDYASKLNYSKYIKSLKKSLPVEGKKDKALERFQKKTGVSFDESESLIGKKGMFEIKKTGQYTWADLKAIVD